MNVELWLSVVISFLMSVVLLTIIWKRKLPNLIQQVLDDVSGSFGEQVKLVFADPNVKKAFTILGNQSGEVRGLKAVENQISSAVLEKTIGDYKPLADTLGIDIDGMIEKYGATGVLNLINKVRPMLGGIAGGMGKINNSKGSNKKMLSGSS